MPVVATYTLTAEIGVFSVTTQAITEDIVEKAEVGSFSLTGQAANKSIGEAVDGGATWYGVQSIDAAA